MKIAMAFGAFDILHPGHANYLEQARKLGDKLIIIVARDISVEKTKGSKPKNSERARFKKVFESQLADVVILGNLEDKYKVLEKYRPDVIALGYDQKINEKELKNKLKELDLKAEIVRLKSYKPEIYKSSKLVKLC